MKMIGDCLNFNDDDNDNNNNSILKNKYKKFEMMHYKNYLTSINR